MTIKMDQITFPSISPAQFQVIREERAQGELGGARRRGICTI
eukprot:CAMPEP_0172649140 /NCGR_PEP_ID=MMETSP1068-20121228/241636_1 /TAXON_ID=35684 /ORGANISM="Pseudopedinella elastica, Strain CCMP716" /LENGTH=41 /DNA_ID= /DNA_START= /DNA_END= /DNA_ORIENTATION=